MICNVDARPRIMFVVTTPFAANAFLALHIAKLSKRYKIALCVNLLAYELDVKLKEQVDVVDISFERSASPFADFVSLITLVIAIFRYRPRSIHSITPKAGLLAMLAGYLTRVPHRWHTFTGQVWVTKRSVPRFVLKMIDRLIVFLSTRVFADSESQCRFLVREGVVRNGGITVLGKGSICGVDAARFCIDARARTLVRERLCCPSDVFVFLYVGRLARDKGLSDLVAAFAEVLNRHPSAMLWVVGPDEAGLLKELQDLSKSFQDAVRWTGATTTPERYMAASDCLVLPSFREGFGSVLVEAGACGVPAIAYRIDGVVDAVEDEQTGLLVECGNISLLRDAMVQMLEAREKCIRLGINAHERVNRYFDSHAITSAWEAHYKKYI